MGQTRKRQRTEQFVRAKLTTPHYDTYLDHRMYHGEDPAKAHPLSNDWDPSTGSCAIHNFFTIESLGFKLTKNIIFYRGMKELKETMISSLLEKMDNGSLIEFSHSYRDPSIYNTIPRNNVYDSHLFVIFKAGSKYFLSQGYQYMYKHSLTSYTRHQIEKMLHELLLYTCDPDNTKHWKDLDLSYYKKYFKADLLVGKLDQLPVIPTKKVNGIILCYSEVKK